MHNMRISKDLDRSRLTDTRSGKNDRIGADTDPEYRIDARGRPIIGLADYRRRY